MNLGFVRVKGTDFSQETVGQTILSAVYTDKDQLSIWERKAFRRGLGREYQISYTTSPEAGYAQKGCIRL